MMLAFSLLVVSFSRPMLTGTCGKLSDMHDRLTQRLMFEEPAVLPRRHSRRRIDAQQVEEDNPFQMPSQGGAVEAGNPFQLPSGRGAAGRSGSTWGLGGHGADGQPIVGPDLPPTRRR